MITAAQFTGLCINLEFKMNAMTAQRNIPEPSADLTFDGPLGVEYALLRQICPAAAEMSGHVGDYVRRYARSGGAARLRGIEIGCGTGITSQALLLARDDLSLTAVDIAPAMLAQARGHLACWVDAGRVHLIEEDALSFLSGVASDSVDLIASGYTLHNFERSYRRQTIAEIFRTLKAGGVFVNGDRYARDDTLEHLTVIQDEVRHFFAIFTKLGRLDLLEQWIVHLFSDESPDHVMPLGEAIECYRAAGFASVTVHHRDRNNALVSAEKPLL